MSYSNQRRRSAWKLKRLPSLINAVADLPREEWSPEQISGLMAPLTGIGVSHQWVYSLIWDDKARGADLCRHLRQPKRRSKYRVHAKSAGLGRIPNRVGIEELPPAHWEGDTVPYGHKLTRIVMLVERRSGYLLTAHWSKVTLEQMQQVMIRLLKPRRRAVKTITLDKGSEFAGHEAVAKAVSASIYFGDPYCSGQRGTNENTKGLIR